MKTSGMAHQLEVLRLMNGRKHFALFMEMGTGKTWALMADAERLYGAGVIDAVAVIAPNGVHTNWTRREIPSHMDTDNIIARAWKSGAGKRYTKDLEELFTPRDLGRQVPLRVLTMNVDAINTHAGYDFMERFLNATRAMLIVDESEIIKNPSSGRTKNIMKLRPKAVVARIASGTPVTNSPVDVFSQMEFLESGLLGTTSYRAFVAEYAELLDPDGRMMTRLAERHPKVKHAQIVARDFTGAPIWKNLDKLQQKLLPHSYRILKRQCLDLPEKIFTQTFFELEPAQRRAYDLLQNELRVEIEDGTVLTVQELASLIKLQQITSGYVNNPDGSGSVTYIGENPRLALLLEVVERNVGPTIIWARFQEELDAIARALRAAKKTVVEYHGRVRTEDRELAVEAFQSGAAEFLVGQPQSGGRGLTLTAAQNVIYYSNDFNLGTRLQSEDRAHRIGTRKNVVYNDLIAADTIDEKIVRVLQKKTNVASEILGDYQR